MISDGLKISLVIAAIITFMGSITLSLLVYTRIKKRKSTSKGEGDHSFQPSVDTDSGDWARFSLRPPPRTMCEMPPPVLHQPSPPSSNGLIYTEQAIDFTRIGTSKEGDTRQRLQSIVSTLSNHHLPADPSSEALDHFRADRIGSVDDPHLLKGSRRPSMVSLSDSQGRKKSGTSTLGTLDDPSVTSFTIERAQRASLSVKKVALGGMEEIVPYITGATMEPPSPTDLDQRFAKPISVLARPPSQIDFTQPKGTPPRQGDNLVAARNPLVPGSTTLRDNRDNMLAPEDRESPSLPRPLERERLPMIDISPLISPKTLDPSAHPSGQEQARVENVTTTPSRWGRTKTKRRPDSIILAHLRSPKLGGHFGTGHLHPHSTGSPPIAEALDGLTAGIATSVLAMKSAGGSTNFPYSLPPSASSASKNDIPKTPRTATSEGCHSAVSDVESAQLFQAWKGSAPPVHIEEPVPAIKRGLSVQANTARPRPEALRRAGTKDGDIDMEIVLNGSSLVPATVQGDGQLSVVRPVVILTPNTAREKDFGVGQPGHLKRASLTPSFASDSSSASSKSKITYLADVVKEQRRSSTLSVVGA